MKRVSKWNPLAYSTRSDFFPRIEKAVRRTAGMRRPARVFLGRGGYERIARVRIESSDSTHFRTTWNTEHPKRFSARLRAAATVLRDEGLYGQYWLCHLNGTLLILPE